jgi:hypothetical protein
MFSRIVLLLCCTACGTNGTGNDAGLDATNDVTDVSCLVPATDASFTCDISVVAPADLACADWVGQATMLDGGGVSCPAAAGWSGGAGNSGCEYKWTSSGTPNLCELPSSLDGFAPFAWLHANCGSGCPEGDAGAPMPCTTSNNCPSTQYCELNGNCAGTGTCFLINGGGVGVPGQVCGCDNKTYASGGAAHQARESIAYFGACE